MEQSFTMKNWITILGLCLCSHSALGGIIDTAPASGWADVDLETRSEEYRWGATARNVRSSANTWELGVGNNTDMTESNSATETDLGWDVAGTLHSFALDYNHSAGQITWTIDDVHSVVLNPDAPLSDLYIQLKARPSSSSTTLPNATFSAGVFDADINPFAASGNAENSQLQFVHINTSEGLLSEMDFLLEGTLIFDWSGAVPTGEEDMGMHIKMTQIPEPASIVMVLLVSVSALFIRRRFR